MAIDLEKDDILVIAHYLSEQGFYYSRQWEQAAAEIERLREALRECANYLEEQTGIAYKYLREPFDETILRRLRRDMARIKKARAALGENE